MSNTEYSTKDLYLASYLQLNKHNVTRVEKQDTKFTFVFNSSKELSELVENFYNGNVQVAPMEYVVAMKQLKSKMYNFNSGRG